MKVVEQNADPDLHQSLIEMHQNCVWGYYGQSNAMLEEQQPQSVQGAECNRNNACGAAASQNC